MSSNATTSYEAVVAHLSERAGLPFSPPADKTESTPMSTLTAQRDIHAGSHTIARVILNIAELADWNPALNSTGTRDRSARIGHPYPVSTRIPGRAILTYTDATSEHITWRLEVAGSTETGRWDLLAQGEETRVIHTMTHTGVLFTLMHSAMTNVPAWRLDRLQQRAEQHSRVGFT